MGLFDNLDPLTLATAGAGAANGYNQGFRGAQALSFQQALQMGQLQAMTAYHMGMVGNGASRNVINSDRYLGMDMNGNAAVGPDGNPIRGMTQTNAQNADTRQATQEGYTDTNGNVVPGALQLRGDQIAGNGIMSLLKNSGAAATNPGAVAAMGDILGGVTGKPTLTNVAFNPSVKDVATTTNLGAGTALTNAKTVQIGGKTVDDFYKNVGDISGGQQAGYTLGINKATGSNYAVPGSLQYPTTPGGQAAEGPPSVTQAYAPLLSQTAGIGLKTAEAGKAAADAVYTAGPKTALTNNQAAVVVPKANAQIGLDAALGTAAVGNMGANQSRATSYGRAVNNTGAYQQGELTLRAGDLSLRAQTLQAQIQKWNSSGNPADKQAAGYVASLNARESKLVGDISTQNALKVKAQTDFATARADGKSPDQTTLNNISNAQDASIQASQAELAKVRAERDHFVGAHSSLSGGNSTAPGAGPIAQSMIQKSGQPCTGTQCGQAITNAMGGQATVTNLRNAAQRNPSLQVRPDAQGRYPNDTILYFKPTNGIVDGAGTNQHYGTVYTGQDGVQRIAESTSAGAPPGGRIYRSDRTVAQVAAGHGNQVVGFRAAGGGNSGNAPGGATPAGGGRATLFHMGIH